MVRIYIGIGSNVGNRKNNISNAVKLLKTEFKVIKLSSLYETEPIGIKDQDWFINAVVCVETEANPQEIKKILQNIEKKLQRIKTIKNGPRTIDLDILLYGNEIINEKDLIIPHKEMYKRKFVLIPFNEIAPGVIHPILNKNINTLLNKIKHQNEQIHKLRGL